MNVFLTLACLFFIGSVTGWVIELLFRNIVHHNKKWVNPGFCTGPYLPIYGFGLCTLYLLANLEQYGWITNPVWNKIVLFIAMAIGMTLIEYIAGLFCLKYFKVMLWDYSNLWGKIQGLICPLFSFFWALLGAVYYFFVHPYVLGALDWLSRNLAFSFFIGMFFGVFLIDVCHSANLVVKLKAFAEENRMVVRYEAVKKHIRENFETGNRHFKYNFFRPFHDEHPLEERLKEMREEMREKLEKYKLQKQ